MYGLIIGGAVGSVLGLLFAPASGKVTRATIREKLAGLFHSSQHIHQHHQSTTHQQPSPYRSDIEISNDRHSEINVVRSVNNAPKKLLLKLADWLEK